MYQVEFVGVPGAGKSTIRNQLVRNLQKINKNKYLTSEEAFLHVARERIDKAYRFTLRFFPDYFAKKFIEKIYNRSIFQFDAQNAFLAHYGKALQIFLSSHEFVNLSLNDRKIVIAGFLHAGAMYQSISDCHIGPLNVFFDEGLVQKSMMFVSGSNSDNEVIENTFNYLNHIPLPDLIINVKTDISVCLKRMTNRLRGVTERLKGHNDHIISDFLEKSEQHLDNVVSWLEAHKKINLVRINNNDSLEDSLKILEEKFKTAGM